MSQLRLLLIQVIKDGARCSTNKVQSAVYLSKTYHWNPVKLSWQQKRVALAKNIDTMWPCRLPALWSMRKACGRVLFFNEQSM